MTSTIFYDMLMTLTRKLAFLVRITMQKNCWKKVANLISLFKNMELSHILFLHLPINVYILLWGGIISVGDTYMNNGKEKSKEKNKKNTKEEYKVKYFFAENSKININEILKNSFLLSLKAEGKKYIENRLKL